MIFSFDKKYWTKNDCYSKLVVKESFLFFIAPHIWSSLTLNDDNFQVPLSWLWKKSFFFVIWCSFWEKNPLDVNLQTKNITHPYFSPIKIFSSNKESTFVLLFNMLQDLILSFRDHVWNFCQTTRAGFNVWPSKWNCRAES